MGRRALQLRRLHSGLRRLPGRQHHPDHAGLHQSEVHGPRHVEHLPHVRPRRPAGRGGRQLLGDQLQGQEGSDRPRQDALRQGLADETKKAMNAKGLTEVMYEGVNTGEKDYSALVSKLKQANVDVVYFGGLHTEAGLIIRQMRDQGLKAPLMGGDGITDKEFVQIAGPGSEGTLMTFSPDARKNPNAKDAVAAFKAKNIDPEAYTLYAYAA